MPYVICSLFVQRLIQSPKIIPKILEQLINELTLILYYSPMLRMLRLFFSSSRYDVFRIRYTVYTYALLPRCMHLRLHHSSLIQYLLNAFVNINNCIDFSLTRIL